MIGSNILGRRSWVIENFPLRGGSAAGKFKFVLKQQSFIHLTVGGQRTVKKKNGTVTKLEAIRQSQMGPF